jgi:hypothetical protein
MFANDRHSMRQFFLHCHNQRRQGAPLQPLEQLVAEVIALHPEYQPLLETGEQALEQDFPPSGQAQGNPFLHMGLHIGLGEQLLADRPAGIRHLYQRLLAQYGNDRHSAEHAMMACLEHSLWQAQQQQRLPAEGEYLDCLRQQLI